MKLPIICPSCENLLNVSRLKCNSCGTEINGDFQMPFYLKLSKEEQEFIMDFFLNSGSIKEMARLKGNSYPTMRNYMDDLIEKIKKMQTTTRITKKKSSK
jgi:hypothetical protein